MKSQQVTKNISNAFKYHFNKPMLNSSLRFQYCETSTGLLWQQMKTQALFKPFLFLCFCSSKNGIVIHFYHYWIYLITLTWSHITIICWKCCFLIDMNLSNLGNLSKWLFPNLSLILFVEFVCRTAVHFPSTTLRLGLVSSHLRTRRCTS